MAEDFRVGEFLVEPSLNRISRDDQVIQIEPKVMELLVYLADHAGVVLSRDRIIRSVWADTFVTDEALWYGISELRRAFGDDAKSPKYIETIPKRGYRLVAPVSPKVEAEALRYRILEKIGQGAMGQIHLAEDTSLKRKVALKFLAEEVEQDQTALRRLVREARAAAALDHPYICKGYDTGELSGRTFIAMEYVEGETLKKRLAWGPVPLKEALRIAAEVAEALEAAAEKKIVLGISNLLKEVKRCRLRPAPQHLNPLTAGTCTSSAPMGQEKVSGECQSEKVKRRNWWIWAPIISTSRLGTVCSLPRVEQNLNTSSTTSIRIQDRSHCAAGSQPVS